MRILVTGHRGYVGWVLVPRLLAAGHEVVGLDAGLFDGAAVRERALPIAELGGDVRDVTAGDLEGFEAVLHLAALSNDPLGDLSPALTDEVNHVATLRLAGAAKAAGVRRFVFSSSCSVYGAAGEAPVDEASPCRPLTPYAGSKLQAEAGLAALADARFSPVSLRNATAYGVSGPLRFDLALNNLVAWAVATGRVYLKSDGGAWRPFVHIEDIASAFLAVLAAPAAATHGEVFNVGATNENYRVRELAEIVRAEVPGTRVVSAADAGPDRRSYRVDCGKIERRLGFRAAWTVREGARELYELCRVAGWQPEEFEGPRFSRLDHLKELMRRGRLGSDLRWRAAPVAHDLV